jgi:hypothetical protein
MKREMDVMVKNGETPKFDSSPPNKKNGSTPTSSRTDIKSFKKRFKQSISTKKELRNSTPNSASKYLKKSLSTDTSDLSESLVTSPSSNNSTVEKDSNGFSHLEWSASVPYNLAEEPDEVCGMKHSHSCQSMPSVTLEEISQQQQKLQQIEEHDDRGETTNKDNLPIDIDETIKELEEDFETFTNDPKSFERQQRELSRKLEEVRIESRSTVREGLLKQKRPRAKSEEASKYPPDRRPRPRLKSDGQAMSQDLPEEESLNAPSMVRDLITKTTDEGSDGKPCEKIEAVASVPPPEQFQDSQNALTKQTPSVAINEKRMSRYFIFYKQDVANCDEQMVSFFFQSSGNTEILGSQNDAAEVTPRTDCG